MKLRSAEDRGIGTPQPKAGVDVSNRFSVVARSLSLLSASLIIIVFFLLSNRGLDFTDESYYLLNFLYWQELDANVTFFGAFFDLPFQFVGGRIPLIRVFGFGLLIAASWYFGGRTLAYFGRCSGNQQGVDRLTMVVVSISIAYLYYGFFGTLRTPSYNLLTLVCMMLSTGIVFDYLSADTKPSTGFLAGLAYGAVIIILVLTKATAAAAMVGLHAFLFFTYLGRRAPSTILTIIPGAVLAVFLFLSVFSLIQPNWFDVLRNGVDLINSTDNRGGLVLSAFREFSWAVQLYIAQHYYEYGLIFLVHVLFLLGLGRRYPGITGYWVLLLILGFTTFVSLSSKQVTWLLPSAYVMFLLWTSEVLLRDRITLIRRDLVVLALPAFLAAMALAFSWGSNMSLLKHSNMAVAFPVLGVFILGVRIRSLGILRHWQFSAVVLLLTLPALVFAVRPWWDVVNTYRLDTPLSQQEHALSMAHGTGPILVDAATKTKVDQFRKILHEAGFQDGDSMLDLTGDAPGLVYVAGAKPMGVAWLLGGYEGSSESTKKTLALVGQNRLRCAWLLSSEDSPRRITDWKKLLEDVHAFAHAEVQRFKIRPHSNWRGQRPETISFAVWRPTGLGCAG